MRLIHTYTKISTFEQCPNQYLHRYILKDTPPQPMSAHLIKGNRIDKDLENGVKGLPLPDDLAHVQSLIDRFKAAHYEVTPQLDLGLDESLRECDYWDNDVCKWRIKIDLVGLKKIGRNAHGATMFDWKSGKVSEDKGQLALYGGALMCKYPYIQEVDTSYIFVEHKKASPPKTFKLDQFKAIWQHFGERAEAIEIAAEKGHFPEKTSPLCAFCPVSNSQCTKRANYPRK